MLSKTLAMIFVGAAFAFSAPLAMAEPVATLKTASVSPADNPAPAKKPVKKKTVKKTTKAKVAKKVEEPAPKKGLFSSLFKPAEPPKPLTKAEKAAAAKAAKAAEAKAKADKAAAAKAAKVAEAKAKADKAAAEKAAKAAEAKAKAAKLAAAKAEKERLARLAEEKARAEEAAIVAVAAKASNNTGELRSDGNVPTDFFSSVFGAKPKVLEETKALDAVLTLKERKKKFKVKSEFEPQRVEFSGYSRGQIVIDTGAKFLYLIESPTTARRYAIAVGREGLEFKGKAAVGDKQEWPRWYPTVEMQKRDPAKYGIYPEGMDGGPDNPLGARAIYLYQGKKDTHVRIHGTNQPQSIGTAGSNGCFRMINEHVIELYNKVKVGTEVIVL
jgi:lipoprotein-anchoring transpeptidase ErfK/SrfK